MIVIRHKGSLDKTRGFLKRASNARITSILERYAQQGVEALSAATPSDTGLTASSWGYKVKTTARGYSIEWTNSNVQNGTPIAIIIQYGHGTGTGGWVEGRDYINPALRPVLDKLVEEAWKGVIRG